MVMLVQQVPLNYQILVDYFYPPQEYYTLVIGQIIVFVISILLMVLLIPSLGTALLTLPEIINLPHLLPSRILVVFGTIPLELYLLLIPGIIESVKLIHQV